MTNTARTPLEYTAALTGNSFLFFETRIVASLLVRGFEREDILNKVRDENLFQYRTTKSVPQRLSAIYRRIGGLDPEILSRLANGTADEAKVIVLLGIARSDRLLMEFLIEVVYDKIRVWDAVLRNSDIDLFFESKAEASPKVAGWTEITLKKLRELYLNILVGTGLLNNRQEQALQKVLLDPEFRQLLARSFPSDLIRAIEG